MSSQNTYWSMSLMWGLIQGERGALLLVQPLSLFNHLTFNTFFLSFAKDIILISTQSIKLPDSCFQGNDWDKNIKLSSREERQREKERGERESEQPGADD